MTSADLYLSHDIKHILKDGCKDQNPRPKYKDGTPAHTYFVTHNVRQYDLSKGEFPIILLRPIAWKSAIKEILWIYQKKSDSLDMLRNEFGIKYWDDWESKNYPGTINSYGSIINKYDLFNKRVLNDIKENPYGRYHVCSMWQEEVFNKPDFDGLKPCCYETIWTVRGEYLDMFLNQRSGDMLTASGAGGVNEVQYAALLMMVARHTGYNPGKFTHFIANEQLYDRHLEQANELLNRFENMRQDEFFHDKYYKTPHLKLNENKKNFYDITIDDFEMINYEPIKPQITLELGI
ncbi:thymidylate synthase [Bariatricus sp. SGI.019]|uniref:thymidylate synthase n=1 Tax=Bariatricus sp. SGI.019 TaxID=3420548 RepID=UPI003D05D841